MKFLKWLLLILIISNQITQTEIRIILTAALTDAYYEFRKQQYIEAFTILKSLGYADFYIVEALKKQRPTFLDDYCKNVFYSSANNPNFKNNGINESITLLEGLRHFNFDPEDMIIKLTGRHSIISDYFFKLVENNPDYDAIAKFNPAGDVATVGFAMRYKYLCEMNETIDYLSMERNWINLETEVANYIKKKEASGNFKVYYVNKLDIKANIYGSSNALGAPESNIIF